jgi:hypothetical protein
MAAGLAMLAAVCGVMFNCYELTVLGKFLGSLGMLYNLGIRFMEVL